MEKGEGRVGGAGAAGRSYRLLLHGSDQLFRAALVSCLLNNLPFAGGNLAILQGASAAPISAANARPARTSAKRVAPENRQSVSARRIALKMGWRRRCGSGS